MRLGHASYEKQTGPLDSVAFFKRFLFISAIVLLVVAVVGMPLWALLPLQTETKDVTVTDLPKSLNNLRVVFASDFHYSASQSRLSLRAVNTINNLRADLVVLGGDYGNTPEDTIAFFESMPKISASFGVYAVLGDADRDAYSMGEITTAMKSAGVTPLINSVVPIKAGDSYLYVAGLDDCYYGQPNVELMTETLRAEDMVILAAHSPLVMNTQLSVKGASHLFDLILLGHTHGGQIRIGSFCPMKQLVQDIPERYYGGWLNENRANVLVSNGVGYSGLPLRLLATPQVHLMKLKVK